MSLASIVLGSSPGKPGFYEVDPLSAYATPVDTSLADNCAELASLGHSNLLYAASTFNDSLHEIIADVGRTGIIVPLTYLGAPFASPAGCPP